MQNLRRKCALLGTLLATALACAQPVPHLNNLTPAFSLVPSSMVTPVKQPCAHPTEPFDIDDYDGPLSRVVSRFSQRLERTTVLIPRPKSDLRPCALSASDKFHMFVESTADPLNYVGAAWDAGLAQIEKDDPSYRQGALGYGKRFGAAVTDNATSDFFGIYLYPSLFRQDPRYYRLGQGSKQSLVHHELAHTLVAQ